MNKWQKITLIGCTTCLVLALLGGIGSFFLLRHIVFASKKVHEVTKDLPDFPKVNVTDPDRFLNDLKLSPLWKVEREHDGSFIAIARSIKPDDPFDESGRMFLFELMGKKDKTLPKDYSIRNRYLAGRKTFSSFSVIVVFKRPRDIEVTFGESGQKATLGVYESYEKILGPNSSSHLAITLSKQHEVYVLLREQGADSTRSTTFAILPHVLRELADIALSPDQYRVEERYEAFFKLFFKLPLGNQKLKHFPGIQDRDTFYGYFRAQSTISYSGINIKISHPVYCPDEGTRKYSRLQKAEYLGTPHHENDILFFLIEDNTVYLSGKYDEQFGTFTGTNSFDGILEILNDKEAVLLKTTDKFKGWQR
jgi:hypothetical protein